jgi:hypothetical protein
MGDHWTVSGGHRKLAGGLLVATLASSALAAAALNPAGGVANATCASISGVGNGGGCTSTATSFAVGLGAGTQADAEGMFNGAFAVGPGSQAFAKGNFNAASAVGTQAFADSEGTGNAAFAMGNTAGAQSQGVGNIAVAVGNPGPNPGMVLDQFTQIPPSANTRTTAAALGAFNRALVIGTGSVVIANGGDANNPLTNIGNNTAIALGDGSNAYAGVLPVSGGTAPNNQFAFAGPGKNALNVINP